MIITPMLRPLLVFWLILYSLRYRTKPWNFFQLNSKHFNRDKNIFSKLDLDDHIPVKWRLHQIIDDGSVIPEFPVYVKPEWGQNSHGVQVAKNLSDLQHYRMRRGKKKNEVAYLLQQVAPGIREFEFFYVRAATDLDSYAVCSLTETVNSSGNKLVVNGVHNRDSRYLDLAEKIGEKALGDLWNMLGSIGLYNIARIGMRADSLEELLAGNFSIIETNIFLPMPLMLLDEKVRFSKKYQFIKKSMRASALLAATGHWKEARREPIFFRKMIAHYKVK